MNKLFIHAVIITTVFVAVKIFIFMRMNKVDFEEALIKDKINLVMLSIFTFFGIYLNAYFYPNAYK